MNLIKQGYVTLSAQSGEEALEIARREQPDLVLLDLMLEGIDGIETCRRFKTDPILESIPVIMVTAKSEESDKVIGLGLGADDYITKPFGIKELFARISAVLRRVEKYGGSDDLIRINDTLIDSRQYQVTCDGEIVNLTLTEFRILKMLAVNRGVPVAREKILLEIIGRNNKEDDRILDVHMRNLRKKLTINSVRHLNIETIRGVGYRISP